MKIIKVSKSGNYTNHGIGYTEHNGYSGTSDNRWSIKQSILHEYNKLNDNEEFQVMVNNKLSKGGAIFKKLGMNDLELLGY